MTLPTPFHVRVKLAGSNEWKTLGKFASPQDAMAFAENNIAKNPKVFSRIELRDAFGRDALRTIWDASWQ